MEEAPVNDVMMYVYTTSFVLLIYGSCWYSVTPKDILYPDYVCSTVSGFDLGYLALP